MRLTVPHYFQFGPERELVGDDLVRAEAWDALRTRSQGPFAIAQDRAELEQTANGRPEIGARTREINALLDARGVRTLASYGVGGAVVEVWLHRLAPDRGLRLTDYAPQTVERLRELFPEAEVVRHDLLVDPPLEADLHLFHRIDTELTNKQFRGVLRRFSEQTVLVVAADVADLGRIVRELRGRLQTRGLTRAGWLRTREAFEALWQPTHTSVPLRLHDHHGWLLEPRSGGEPPA